MTHNYLFIDTSAETSLVFLFNEEKIIASKSNLNQQEHSKYIHTHIEELLQENHLSYNNLDAIVVLNGPGSYTGLRISLATAKGICYAHNIPLVLLNLLDVLAFSLPTNENNAIALLAREGEYFFASYFTDDKKNKLPCSVFENELLDYLKQMN